MNIKIRVVFCCILVIFFGFSTAMSEKSIEEIMNIQLDEELVKTIKYEAKLPNDYDVCRAVKGMEYLIIYEDFSIPGAAGLIGNGYAESRLLLNPGKSSYKGLFQWDGKIRWPRVKDFLEQNDVDFENEEELFFWELVAAINSEDGHIYQDVIDYCKDSSDAKDSANRWCRKFEGVTQALSTRKKIAGLTVTAFKVYMNLNNEDTNINMSDERYSGSLLIRKMLCQKGLADEYQLTALFYDLFEKSEITYYEIAKISSIDVAEAVRIIADNEVRTKKDYYSRIKQNDISKMVALVCRINTLRNLYLVPKKSRKLLIEETEDYFVDLAKGTVFEEDLKNAIEKAMEFHCFFCNHLVY